MWKAQHCTLYCDRNSPWPWWWDVQLGTHSHHFMFGFWGTTWRLIDKLMWVMQKVNSNSLDETDPPFGKECKNPCIRKSRQLHCGEAFCLLEWWEMQAMTLLRPLEKMNRQNRPRTGAQDWLAHNVFWVIFVFYSLSLAFAFWSSFFCTWRSFIRTAEWFPIDRGVCRHKGVGRCRSKSATAERSLTPSPTAWVVLSGRSPWQRKDAVSQLLRCLSSCAGRERPGSCSWQLPAADCAWWCNDMSSSSLVCGVWISERDKI